MANQDAWRQLRKRLRQQGLAVVLSKSCHYKVYQGKRLVASMPSSSGGGRGYNNAVAELRRKGVTV